MHHGVSNCKLRVQLPLTVGDDGACVMEVGGVTVAYTAGRSFVFDDSFAHGVRNASSQARAVLVVDVWHPQLSQASVALIAAAFEQPPTLERALVQTPAPVARDKFYIRT